MCHPLTQVDVGKRYQLEEFILCRGFPVMSYYLVAFDEESSLASFAEWPDWKPNIFLKQDDYGGDDSPKWRRWVKVKRSLILCPGAIGQKTARYSWVEVKPIPD